MDIVIVILNLLILAGISVATMIWKNYFAKYVSEKAKNLATKEDITDITRQIENVKSEYALILEKSKSEFQVKSALHQAYQSKCLEALVAVNDLLVEIHQYFWKQLVERSPNEHYVWSNVDDSDDKKHFHYYRVAVDKIAMVYGLYLSRSSENALRELADQIGFLSRMELALVGDDPHPEIEASADSGYEIGIEAVQKCRKSLINELGIINES